MAAGPPPAPARELEPGAGSAFRRLVVDERALSAMTVLRRRPGQARRTPGLGVSAVPAALLVAFLALPVLGMLVRATTAGGLWDALGRPVVLDALKLSLLSTSIVLVLTLILGSPLALILARRRFWGIGLVDSLVDLPIVLPPAVAGLALLLTFGRRGLLGGQLSALGIELPFTTAAVVLASFFVAAPFFVRAARAGFLAVPRELEEAARVEGATEWAVFRYVTAPVAAPALFGGAVLSWARALGEFGATVMFAGQFQGRTQTMPLAIYAALESDTDAALALSILLLGISFVLLVLFRRWLQGASEPA
ncbi:MAG TPA: ABC transporter permease [Chloroflexota bacterium]|nr:ABC transporter permease [Chloroflexota bacterium]